MTTTDEAVLGYTDTVHSITNQHNTTVAAAETEATDALTAAEEKFLAAKTEYERAIEHAEETLRTTVTDATTTRTEALAQAEDQLDTELRRSVRAPANARLVPHGGRVVLDLGDGRPPIAHMAPVGGGMWQVEGAGQETTVVGDALTARRQLWERCLPAPA